MPYDEEALKNAKELQDQIGSKIEVVEVVDTSLNVDVNERSAKENREVIETLINELVNTGKYKKAIKGGRFAQFSLVGTADWEDYASLSLQSLQLLALANIDENLEKIRIFLENSEKSDD